MNETDLKTKDENSKTQVTLEEILTARENRVLRQKKLLEEYRLPLISFTMNIAGPVKSTPDIRRLFEYAFNLILTVLKKDKIPVKHTDIIAEKTGNEAFMVADTDALTLKRLMVSLEDEEEAGRLFDIDVIDIDGKKIDREAVGGKERPCLICGGSGKACARSRAHTVEELQKKTNDIVSAFLMKLDAKRIAKNAVKALLYEANVTPKPGLVDRNNTGSHKDMDSFTFIDSAQVLYPYFKSCALIGMRTKNLTPGLTFEAIRKEGIAAEQEMLKATNGVNTHKGAVFSMGILCAAIGRTEFSVRRNTDRLLNECSLIAKGIVENDFEKLTKGEAKTTGERLYLNEGVKGARGEAENGFPAVKYAFPFFKKELEKASSFDRAGAVTLLHIFSAQTDTNMIKRSDKETYEKTKEKLKKLLKASPFPADEEIIKLDEEFIEKNLSPGGGADMLALCFMLYFTSKQA